MQEQRIEYQNDRMRVIGKQLQVIEKLQDHLLNELNVDDLPDFNTHGEKITVLGDLIQQAFSAIAKPITAF